MTESTEPKFLRTVYVDDYSQLHVYDSENECYIPLPDLFRRECSGEIETVGLEENILQLHRGNNAQAISYSTSAQMKLCCWPLAGFTFYITVPAEQPCPF